MGRALAVLAALAAGAAGAQTIEAARYDGPTDRYPHGVLGDEIEHDTLTVTLSNGRDQAVRWSDQIVFEDTAPRLADLDGDGAPEVVVVEAHERLGARLAVWGLVDGQLAPMGATGWIGTRFRWLAPAGIGDLDGDGTVEIAYVDRPHLARVLRVVRVTFPEPGTVTLTEVASLGGLSNHRIGDETIAGGLRACGQGPEMVLADAGWSRIVAVRFAEGELRQTDLGPLGSGDPVAQIDARLTC